MTGRHRNPDPATDLSRRRFLAGLVGVAGLGTLATVLRKWMAAGESGATTVTTSAAAAPTSTTAATTASTAATSTTTRAASTTTFESTTTSSPDSTTTTEPPTTTSTSSEPTTTTTTAATAGGTLVLLEKQAWGAEPEGDGFQAHSIVRITVHHTAVVLGTNSKAPARFRQHQTYHQSQGWPDLAYHVMIDRAGNLYEGRPMEYRGDTFTSYDPSGHFLPCLEGDFNSESPTGLQIEALAQLCAWAANRWGIDIETIGGHRDYASTSCPGTNLYDDLSGGSLEGRVAEILAGGAPSLAYLRGADAVAVVAAVEAGA